jgi:hypothetical protein
MEKKISKLRDGKRTREPLKDLMEEKLRLMCVFE